MFNAISIAASGLATQGRRVEAVARQVASMGATAPATNAPDTPTAPIRIGALPIGDPVQSVVTLVEAEMAYRMNVAVMATAAGMLDSLLDAFEPRK